jgi:glycosyltransferase involved in cell wall biosynthesis
MNQFSGRLALQQRVFPAYRAAFFDGLAAHCTRGLSVFAGEALPQEQIPPAGELQVAQFVQARNRHLFDPSSPFYYCWQPRFIHWLESWQPDALAVEANPRYRSTPQAVRWMHARGRPVLGWGLGAPPLDGWFSGWRGHSRRLFLESLDGLIAYSRRGAEEYTALGFPRERIFAALNAVDPAPQMPPPVRPSVMSGKPVVLFVGRLQRRKRVDLLLRACASLPVRFQPELVVVGDGPERGRLEKLAHEIYLNTQFTGDRRGVEMEKLFARADLFVLPGTGGLAVQQAMRWGLPVIAAQGDGTQDDLVQPENGWRVPPGDLQELTRTLQSALEDAPRLHRMGQASFQIVQEQANTETMAEVFILALNSITAQVNKRKE